MFSLKTDLLLVKQTFTSPGYTIAGFGCQIHVASYCWNASVLHFAQFSFPPFIRSLWTFSPCLLTISERCWGWRRRGWGIETPLVLEPPSAVLFRFFCLPFPSFLSSFLPPTLLLTSLVSYPPSLEVTLRSHLRHGVFRPSEIGCCYSLGRLCVRWEKASFHLGRCCPDSGAWLREHRTDWFQNQLYLCILVPWATYRTVWYNPVQKRRVHNLV